MGSSRRCRIALANRIVHEEAAPSRAVPAEKVDSLQPTGASGTGRTTFVNTLVEQPLIDHNSHSLLTDPGNPHSQLDLQLVRQSAEQAHVEDPIRIAPVNVELEEDGVRIALTIVDTPGFGDGVDNEYWFVNAKYGVAVFVCLWDAASKRFQRTSNVNTTISWRKNRGSSGILASEITGFTLYSTLSRLQAMRQSLLTSLHKLMSQAPRDGY